MDRDFDIEKVIDKMRELRDRRDLEIIGTDFDKINLDVDYKKDLPNKVLDVKYLGTIEWEENGDKSQKGIYLIIEQMKDKNGELIKVEKYYTEDYEFLGGNNKGDLRDFILLKEEYSKDNELLEKLNNLDKEGILDLEEIDQERIEKIAKVLKIDSKDIKKIAEIDKEQLEEAEQKVEQEENGEEKETLTKKEIEKVHAKQEIEVNQKVTDNETMASMLNVQDKGYKKLAIIYSDEMKDSGNGRFSIVGIKEDGSAEKIDTLEQSYGTNPTKEINALNQDGSKIESKQAQSIFSIKGENEKQISVRIGTLGTIETDLVRTPRQANQEAISIPIENHSVKPNTRETMELMNEQRNPDILPEIERIKSHEEAGCEEAEIKDINDNPKDDTHKHIILDEAYLRKCVNKILENDEISSAYNYNDVEARILKELNSKDYMSIEELLQNVETQMENDAQIEHDYHQLNLE